MFKLPLEASQAHRQGGYFDPNFGLGIERNFSPPSPEAILDKANKWLNDFGYSKIVEEDLLVEPQYISSEVGDDEETASNSKAFIALQLVNHELFGMMISREDTSISSRFGNFAEDLIILPDGYGQTYLNARKTSNFQSMSYIDIPKLRLAIDIRPMRMDHSSTNDGKASMIGSRQQWIPLESPFRGSYEVFNLFQDINLGLHRDKKFPYLPSSLGGYGKSVPFSNALNLERFMKAYKQGSHSELIRNIVNRTINYLTKLSSNESPAKDPLLSHIVRFQSSFHDWVKGRSVYAPVTWLDVPTEVGKFRAAKLGESRLKDEVIIRLLAERKLLSEQQLEIAVEHNELCKALLSTESITDFKRIRDEQRMRWQSFSIFSLENYGMVKELSLDMSFGKRPLREIDINFFNALVKEHRYNLRFILGEEFVYWPEAMDEIYKRGPMKVDFELMPINKIGTRGFAARRSEYKSDYEDVELKDAIPNLEVWARSGFIGKPPTEILNDDSSIINECSKSMYNIIVTDDIKLCREAASKTRNIIFRIPCLWYHKHIYFGVEDPKEAINRLIPGKEWSEHIDSGSIKAFEESHFRDGVMLSKQAEQKFSAYKTIKSKDKVVITELEDYSDGPGFDNLEILVHDTRNTLRLRRNRRGVIPTTRRH